MNKTLVALAGIAAFLVVAYLGYSLLAPQVNQCEAIFQQTAPSLEANVKFLKTEGALVLGQTQIQELSNQAQQIGMNLKSCCVMAGAGNLDQFNQCKASAVLYDKQVAEAVAAVKSVPDSGTDQAQKQKEAEERLAQIIQSANEASSALKQQVEQISNKQPDQSGAPPAQQGPGTLRLRAALTPGGDLVDACFEIYDPKEDAQGKLKQLGRKCSEPSDFELPAGEYVVDALSGASAVRSTMTVVAGQRTEAIVDMNSGYLKTHALLAEDGERADACFEIFEAKEDIAGNHRPVTRRCSEAPTMVLLPAGDYMLNVTSGKASTRLDVKIAAGKRTDQPVILNAGILRTDAKLTSDGETVSACFEVYDPNEDSLGNFKQIARTCDNGEARLTLPAGNYNLSAQAGSAGSSVGVTIVAGKPTKQTVVLNAGYLRVEARTSGDTQRVYACFDVYEPKQDVSGNRKYIKRICDTQAVFTLPAGSYYLEAKAGDATGQQMVDVAPGDEPNDYVVNLSKS